MCQKGIFTYFHPTSVECKLQPSPFLCIPSLCTMVLISFPITCQNYRSPYFASVFQNLDITNTSQNESRIPSPSPKGIEAQKSLGWHKKDYRSTCWVINQLLQQQIRSGRRSLNVAVKQWQGHGSTWPGRYCRRELKQQWRKPGPIPPLLETPPWLLSPGNSQVTGLKFQKSYILFDD